MPHSRYRLQCLSHSMGISAFNEMVLLQPEILLEIPAPWKYFSSCTKKPPLKTANQLHSYLRSWSKYSVSYSLTLVSFCEPCCCLSILLVFRRWFLTLSIQATCRHTMTARTSTLFPVWRHQIIVIAFQAGSSLVPQLSPQPILLEVVQFFPFLSRKEITFQ